ncbi:MAG: O-antigen ligase family protein, partial [Candidatus Saccharimonadales bacterium]
VIYLLSQRLKVKKGPALAAGLILLISSISLLLHSPLSWALIGHPTVHPGLLSLLASLAVAITIARFFKIDIVFKFGYLLIILFQLANLIYWLTHGVDSRLGILGIQLNYTAFLAVCGLILGVGLAQRKQMSVNSLLACEFVLMACVLMTQSRAAIALALIASALFIAVLFKQALKPAAVVFSALLAVMLIAGARLNSFHRLHDGQYLDSSYSYRLDLNKAVFPKHPADLILGGGVSSLERNIGQNGLQYPPIAKDIRAGWRFESSHNYFVDLLVERGLVVLFVYLCLIIMAIRAGLAAKNPDSRIAVGLLLASLLFLSVNNTNIEMESLFWTFLFICLIGTQQS